MTRGQAAARRLVFLLLSRVHRGQLIVHEDGREFRFGPGGDDEPSAVVHVVSPRAWPLLVRGSSGLGRAYADGHWDSPDLTSLIRIAAVNTAELDAVRRWATPVRVPFQRLRSRRVTERQGRTDISRHYDLGTALFERMLDPTMMYSSAYFADPGMTLEEASIAKLELTCDKLELGPADHVLEIGSGWGTFAVHAATTRGCRVTTTTISADQLEHARARVRAAGVEHLVTVVGQDYRVLAGSYDKLVSLEMIEAVGWRDFDTFFRTCSDRLKPEGLMLLQAITMDDRAYAVEKASRSFIRTFVFPNGCLPSLTVIQRCLAAVTDLSVVGLQDLTPHYVETLRHWRANFEAALGELEALGYDDPFQRIWRLYLAYCEAGFAERRISVAQCVLAKPGWRAALPESVAVVRLAATA